MGKRPKQVSDQVMACPHCGSTQVYYRSRSEDWLCRLCARTFRKPSHRDRYS